ncbi:glycoside hydrolase family 25 protein [Nonomuraea rubra]|uniref:GH25 family lysozyme M1 (1,4-beta-N-acetylmuramidase) n=1 Tax=Nonomuraea rubra TaxID=46180 RepID=A0A7X0U079_9ACTN|nr:GH25 family lysozyme [Nonomuraea rubra]MBB6550035.1 GH25 family lysozyme M1 (1,4-beta-N-acetylmuramidase) [Nonomuraea rubra]
MLKPKLAATLKNQISERFGLAVGGAILASAAALTGVAGTAPASPAGHVAAPEVQHETRQEAHQLSYGLDISNYEPLYDWSASSAQFGIVKATEGTGFRDASFARHWRELGDKGIVRGAYHYGHPGNDPIAEADHFLSVLNAQPAKPGDLLVLDLETSDGRSVEQVNAWARAWLSHVKAKTGVTPMFYSGWNFADTYGKGLAEYPLWVAHYGRAKGAVTPPADWKSWTIHQYTDSPIDQNVSALSPDQLRGLGRPA